MNLFVLSAQMLRRTHRQNYLVRRRALEHLILNTCSAGFALSSGYGPAGALCPGGTRSDGETKGGPVHVVWFNGFLEWEV